MLRQTLPALLLGALGSLAGSTLGGCAAPEGEETQSTEEAYTVANGDRYLVSGEPGKVVLRKSVDGKTFPFAPEEIRGKAILLHPIKRKLEAGLYARAVSVEETESTYVVTTEPLLFEEMEELAESNIIRIYVDRALPKVNGDAATMALGPQTFAGELGGGIRPAAWGGLLTGELPIEGELGPLAVAPRIRVGLESADLRLKPQARAGWQRGRGLELGFKMDYGWDATLAFEAEMKAGFKFETPRVRTPTIVVAVPIGPVPVPVTLGLAGNFECRALGTVEITGKVIVHIAASFGGSSFLKPSIRTAPSQWVKPGAWPWQATGSASLTREGSFEIAPGAELECLVPRVDLETLVAGVAGPFLTVAPVVGIGTEGAEVGVEIKAGLEAKLFGREARGEVVLLSWSPN